MNYRYDLEEASAHLSRACPQMAKLIATVGPFDQPIDPEQSPYQYLTRAIIYQQLSGKAAGTIYRRFVELFAPASFPEPEQLAESTVERLRMAGVSRNKALALIDLARKHLEGTIPDKNTLQELDDEAVIERVIAVRGIGRWSAQMLLMFHLGRPDVFPTTDLGIRKGLRLVLGLDDLPSANEAEPHGERWRPYRSLASWYLWRAL